MFILDCRIFLVGLRFFLIGRLVALATTREEATHDVGQTIEVRPTTDYLNNNTNNYLEFLPPTYTRAVASNFADWLLFRPGRLSLTGAKGMSPLELDFEALIGYINE